MRVCVLKFGKIPFRRISGAFSLLEVVVAVGIFAIGMTAVVAMFAPIARSVAGTSDAEAAARVSDALRAKLQTMSFAEIAVLLKNSTATGHSITASDARSDYDITRDPQLFFANRDGSKIGTYADSIWVDANTRRNTDREKFFEIALIRNEVMSPKPPGPPTDGGEASPNPDDSAVMLAYTARLRWPAFIADTATTTTAVGSNPTGAVRFDQSKKQVLFFTGSVTR